MSRLTSWSDAWYRATVHVGTWATCSILLFILAFLLRESWPAWNHVGVSRFLTDDAWFPLSGQFNLRPMWIATLLTSIGAVLLATPIAVASALFLQFYVPPRMSGMVERLWEVIAAIPSVCFGLWGLSVLAPWIAKLGGSGQSLLTATLTLSLMILPIIALTSLMALRALPATSLDAAAALGLSRAEMALKIAMPLARRGIGVGVILGLGRAIGETMAVVMVAGNVAKVPSGLLDPVRTSTANIALEMGYASADHRAILYATALMLLGMISVLAGLGWLYRSERHV